MRQRAALFLVAFAPGAGLAAPSDALKSLIDQGKAAEAYELGKRTARGPSDDPFDYYLGIAAIDSGRVAEGVEILRKYLERHPVDLRARLELGRGYFLLNDDRRAREEFEAVRATRPPPQVSANIELYLQAIRQREAGRGATTFTGYLEVGGGYDSNVNGGVSNSNIILPVLGNVIVEPTGTRAGDNFGRVAAGAQVSHPLSGGFGLFAAAYYDARAHPRQTQFDQTNYGAAGGLGYAQGSNVVRGTLSWSSLEVDYDRFRDIRGFAVEWQHQLNPAQVVFLSGQTARFDYAGANEVRNADFNAVGAGFRQGWNAAWQPAVTLSLNASEERNRKDRDDLSNDRYAVRAAVDFKPGDRWAMSTGITYQAARYDQPDVILGVARKDEYYSADFSASYFITRDFTVRGEVSFADNRSNIELYSYKRNVAAVNLRYEFR